MDCPHSNGVTGFWPKTEENNQAGNTEASVNFSC